jgi:hypothetical protein
MITTCCQVSSWLTGTVWAQFGGESTDHGVQAEIYARGDAAGQRGWLNVTTVHGKLMETIWKLYVIRDGVARDEWILVFRVCSQKTKLISTNTSIKSH